MKALLQLFEVTFQLVALLAELMEPIVQIYNGIDIVTEARSSSPMYRWTCPTLENPTGGFWDCDGAMLNCSLGCDPGFVVKREITLTCFNDIWVGDMEDADCLGVVYPTSPTSGSSIKTTTPTTTTTTTSTTTTTTMTMLPTTTSTIISINTTIHTTISTTTTTTTTISTTTTTTISTTTTTTIITTSTSTASTTTLPQTLCETLCTGQDNGAFVPTGCCSNNYCYCYLNSPEERFCEESYSYCPSSSTYCMRQEKCNTDAEHCCGETGSTTTPPETLCDTLCAVEESGAFVPTGCCSNSYCYCYANNPEERFCNESYSFCDSSGTTYDCVYQDNCNDESEHCCSATSPSTTPETTPSETPCDTLCMGQDDGAFVSEGCCKNTYCVCSTDYPQEKSCSEFDRFCDYNNGTGRCLYFGQCNTITDECCARSFATDHKEEEPCSSHGQGSSFWSSKPHKRNEKQPRISASTIEKGIQESYGIISMCLSQIPGIFLAIVAIKTVIRDKLGGQELARASYFIIFPFPILKSFATIKDMKWLIGLRHLAEKLFPQKSIDILEEKHKTGEEAQETGNMRQSFYFLISNLCFASVLQLAIQCFIYLQFPSRSANYSQIFSISTSFLFTVFNASQNLGYDGNENQKTFFEKIKLGVKRFIIFCPFIISSLVFNIGTTILAFQTENPYFLFYLPSVIISIFLPAYYPPISLFARLVKKLNLTPRFETNETFQTRSTSRGLFRAFSNFFLVLRGFDDPSNFLVLIYPLHFIVNILTLMLVIIYNESSSQGQLAENPSFEENHKLSMIFVIFGFGLINVVMLPFFAYKNMHSILRKMFTSWSCQRSTTYIVSGTPSLSDKWFAKESSC